MPNVKSDTNHMYILCNTFIKAITNMDTVNRSSSLPHRNFKGGLIKQKNKLGKSNKIKLMPSLFDF